MACVLRSCWRANRRRQAEAATIKGRLYQAFTDADAPPIAAVPLPHDDDKPKPGHALSRFSSGSIHSDLSFANGTASGAVPSRSHRLHIADLIPHRQADRQHSRRWQSHDGPMWPSGSSNASIKDFDGMNASGLNQAFSAAAYVGGDLAIGTEAYSASAPSVRLAEAGEPGFSHPVAQAHAHDVWPGGHSGPIALAELRGDTGASRDWPGGSARDADAESRPAGAGWVPSRRQTPVGHGPTLSGNSEALSRYASACSAPLTEHSGPSGLTYRSREDVQVEQ